MKTHRQLALLDIFRAARRARMHPETLRRAARVGALPFVTGTRKKQLFRPQDVDTWVSRRSGVGRSPSIAILTVMSNQSFEAADSAVRTLARQLQKGD